MASDAGRFDAHDFEAATDLMRRVLEQPGRWCNLFYEPIDDDNIIPESPLFGFLAARGPSNPLATLMTPKAEVDYLVEVGIQHGAGTKAAAQLKEAQLFGPTTARVVQDHPGRGLVIKWPQDADLESIVTWLFPAMRVLARAPSTNVILWEMQD